MNILVLTPWYPTQDHRYWGVFVREYAKAIQSRCNVTVFHCGLADKTLTHWWAAVQEHDQALTDGIRSYRVLYRRTRIKGISFLRYQASVCRAAMKLSKECGRPNLIHAHVYSTGLAGLLTGRMFRIPVVISEHLTAFARGPLPRRYLCETRFVFRMADAVLPVSHALQKTLQENGVKASFQVVPNVINTALFHYQTPHSPSNGVLHLLAVSSLVKHKGLAYLFQALTMVPWKDRAWRLDVVGDGPEVEQYFQLVKNLKISDNVIFHGQMLKNGVARMMRAADLFVLPSIIETFSVATAEALASGLPVIVTRCGGPEEFVTASEGILVSPGNSEELADALTRMIEHLPTYDRAAIAQKAKEKFGAARVGATLCELYERLVNRTSC